MTAELQYCSTMETVPEYIHVENNGRWQVTWMLGFVKLMKHRKTANVMLKNDKGDCFFFLTKEVLASYFSFQVFVSHSDSGLFFSFFFSFLWLFPTSFLTAKSLMIKHKISHYMHKMTGWGCSKRPQKCAHSSLRFVRVIPSIQACTELGL